MGIAMKAKAARKHVRGKVRQRVAEPGWNGKRDYIRLDAVDEAGKDFHLYVRTSSELADVQPGSPLKVVVPE